MAKRKEETNETVFIKHDDYKEPIVIIPHTNYKKWVTSSEITPKVFEVKTTKPNTLTTKDL